MVWQHLEVHAALSMASPGMVGSSAASVKCTTSDFAPLPPGRSGVRFFECPLAKTEGSSPMGPL
jgi:hypothetical protein